MALKKMVTLLKKMMMKKMKTILQKMMKMTLGVRERP